MHDMELQLRLALPNNHFPSKSFDLNNVGCEPKEGLGLGLGLKPWKDGGCFDSKNKRSFEDAFGKIRDDQSPITFLLLSSGQPNEEDDQKGQNRRTSSTINKNEDEEKLLVGWPPIQTWRKKLLHQGQVDRIENNNRMANQKENNLGASNSKFVKVKMEGVTIARKVNLRLFHSFQTLTDSLIPMFSKYQKYEKPGTQYTLAYQDKEGDWMLAGDVPWQTFIESVQRLEILRSGS